MKTSINFHRNIEGLTLLPTIFIDTWEIRPIASNAPCKEAILIAFIFLRFSLDLVFELKCKK